MTGRLFARAALAAALLWPAASAAQPILTPAPPDVRPAEELAALFYREADGANRIAEGIVTWRSRNAEGGFVVEGAVSLPGLGTAFTIVIGPDAEDDFVFDIAIDETGTLPVELTTPIVVATGPVEALEAFDAFIDSVRIDDRHFQVIVDGGLPRSDLDQLLAASELHLIFATTDGEVAALRMALGESGASMLTIAGFDWLSAPVVADGREHFGPFAVDPAFPRVLFLEGEILGNGAFSFAEALGAFPEISLIVLSSPGGDGAEARAIATEIDRLGFDTIIPSNGRCFSACATIFFAGHQRVALGALGVHRVGLVNASDDPDLARRPVGETLELQAELAVPLEIVLAELRTPHEEIRVFLRQELAALGANRGALETMAAYEPALLELPAFRGMADLLSFGDDPADDTELAGAVEWRAEDGAVMAIADFADIDLGVRLTFRDAGPPDSFGIDIALSGASAALVDAVYGLSVESLDGRDRVWLTGRIEDTAPNAYRLVANSTYHQRNRALLQRNELALLLGFADGRNAVVLFTLGHEGQALMDAAIAAWDAAADRETRTEAAILSVANDDGTAETFAGNVIWAAGLNGRVAVSVFFPVLDFLAAVLLWQTDIAGYTHTLALDWSQPQPPRWDGFAAIETVGAKPAATATAKPFAGDPDEDDGLLYFDFRPSELTAPLMSQDWIEIVFTLGDGRRAVLSLQKETIGAPLFETLAGEAP